MKADKQRADRGKKLRDNCTCRWHTEDMCGDMTGYRWQPVRVMLFEDDCPVHGKPQDKGAGDTDPPGAGPGKDMGA